MPQTHEHQKIWYQGPVDEINIQIRAIKELDIKKQAICHNKILQFEKAG